MAPRKPWTVRKTGRTGALAPFGSASVPGGFLNPTLPAGFVPFNVEDIGGKGYVTYAPAGRDAQLNATAGEGWVSVFDENGNLLQNLVMGGALAAPWGLAIAPAGFGPFGGDLLVGNFSSVDSGINAFNATTGAFEGHDPGRRRPRQYGGRSLGPNFW